MQIVELSADGVRAAADEPARLLLDAHASNMAEIVRLAVRGDRRGSGIGRALLEAATERGRALGLRLLWLSTHAETASDGFYAAAGWSRLGVLPAYSVRPDGTLAGSAFYFREL